MEREVDQVKPIRNKRGQATLGNVFSGGVGGAVAFGVIVIALSLIGQILATQQATQGTTSVSSVTNESVTANATLANAVTPTIDNNIDNTSEVVHNGTGGGEILTRTTHYTLLTSGAFTILPGAAGTAGDVEVNISYNYTVFAETAAYNITGSGLTGTLNVGDLVPTMGLIFGIIIVLALLVGLVIMFGGGGMGGDMNLGGGVRSAIETFKR